MDSKDLAKIILAVFFDVDGVFTDNRVLEGAPYKAKWRSYYDGQGVSLLRAIGLHVCLITNEKGDSAKGIVDVVEKWNNLPSSQKIFGDGGWHHVRLYTGMGGTKKVIAAEEWLKEIGVTFDRCAFMGDDLVDVPLLQKVALAAAPISADPAIKKIVHFISERPGGYGALRDFVNFILNCRGINPLALPPQ
ncbi:MAG: HAD hydrolase family protein [Candidatus Yanofskybacteria bacterium]|nr:HAD hydrolase family protein [Candidatus Yanofskybacteria bacterium]